MIDSLTIRWQVIQEGPSRKMVGPSGGSGGWAPLPFQPPPLLLIFQLLQYFFTALKSVPVLKLQSPKLVTWIDPFFSLSYLISHMSLRFVGWSVGMLVTLYFFYDFYVWTSPLLPKWSSDLKYGPCPPAYNFGSRASCLLLFLFPFFFLY